MPAQAGRVEHNNVIKAFATEGANDPFDIGALPRRAWCRQSLFDTHRLDLVDEITAEDAVTIAQQELRRAVPRKSFPKLVRSPLGSGMCSHREVNDAATLVCQHQEDVEDLKPDCRDGEEVYGHKGLEMVLEEGPPSLRRWFPITHEILAHARLPDVDAELQKLAVNVRRAPAWILFAHAADEVADFAWDRRPPGLASPDLPRPEKAKCLAVPGDYSFRLHDHERRAPICPHAR